VSVCPFCGGDPSAPIYGRWEILLALEPPSQNEIAGNKGDFASRRRYKKYRDDYGWLLKSWAREIPPPAGRRRVIVTRYYAGRGRRYDKGNLIGGCKPLLDAMVLAGLLIDDCEEDVEDHYGQERADHPGVHIILEEL
jgi:hypothetical protein